MQRERLTRRGALRFGGGTVLAGMTAGLAGCGGLLGVGEDDAEFTQWLPAPGTVMNPLDGEPREHYGARFYDMQARRDHDDIRVPGFLSPHASAAGVTADDVETVTWVQSGWSVLTGNFDAGTVTDELEQTGHTGETEHGGFTIYSIDREEDRRGDVVGVSDDAVVLSGDILTGAGLDTKVGWIEAVIDARNGEVDRYPEASEDFDLLVDEVGTGVDMRAQTQPEADETRPTDIPLSRFDGEVAQGVSTRIDGDTVRQTWAKVFTDVDAVPSEDLAAWVEEYEDELSAFGRFEEFSTEESDRVWTVSGPLKPSFIPDDSADTPTTTGSG